jgi:hypothetical protein
MFTNYLTGDHRTAHDGGDQEGDSNSGKETHEDASIAGKENRDNRNKGADTERDEASEGVAQDTGHDQ